MIKKFAKKQIRKTGTFRELEIKNKRLNGHVNKLKSENKGLKDRIVTLKSENNNFKGQVNVLMDENKSLKGQVNILRSEKENLEGQIVSLESENNNFKGQVNALRDEKESLKGRVDTLMSEKESLKDWIVTLESENNNFKGQVNALRDEKESLKGQNNHLKSREKNLMRLSDNLRAETRSINEVFEKNIKSSSDYSNLTVIIPYRKTDDLEREENVDITLGYLSKIGISNLIISEHSDISSKEFLMNEYAHLFNLFKVIHTDADGELFNKAKAINRGILESGTSYVVIFDMDCLTKKSNVDLAIGLLDYGFEIVYPFNRKVIDITDKEKFKMEYNFEEVESVEQDRPWADGGIVFWNKCSLISIGMKNEYFSGWGGEDNEILVRANLCQLKEYRIESILYHLYHYRPLKRTQNNVDQLEKTMQMNSKEDCLNEVKEWPWVIEAKKKFYGEENIDLVLSNDFLSIFS